MTGDLVLYALAVAGGLFAAYMLCMWCLGDLIDVMEQRS